MTYIIFTNAPIDFDYGFARQIGTGTVEIYPGRNQDVRIVRVDGSDDAVARYNAEYQANRYCSGSWFVRLPGLWGLD